MSCRSLLILLLVASPANAQPTQPDPTKLTLDRIFVSDEFRGDRIPTVKWLESGSYTTTEPSKTHKGASDIVRFDAAGKSELLVLAEKLIPPNAKDPLAIQGYELSKDLDVVLIFTNSVKVWRQNTRGDYWTFRRSTGKLAKLGGEAKPSTLMFAKLSPDGTRVGYVRENNVFVEPVEGGTPVAITTDGSNDVINGTFDWVYEEEFACRDGWRWSPDGKSIAYWQLDTRGVKSFTLIDNTTENYPILRTFAYPKTGERNSACRVGVVSATGGATKWIEVPGDTRTDFYIPRMEWAGNSRQLIVQRVNRLQNAVDVMYADASTGQVQSVLTERDGAWVDVNDDPLELVENGKAITWLSERDGWQHLYFASQDGSNVKRITSGKFDVIRVLRIDEKAGFVYFIASPDNPTQRYLYRSALNGTGRPERLSPAQQEGWHDYNFSPEGTFAVHTYSSFGNPPRVELVSLPEHKVVRTLASNDKLRAALAKLTKTPAEFFRAASGGTEKLDGWLMKPATFDPAKQYPIVFYVYGEPASQSVTDRWSGNQYLWHLLLTQQGYAVACIDNRGTPCPRGRDWRKAAYRRVGTLASEDQAIAARDLLKQRPYLDPTRVGAWGWSGGGSLTLNLMFRHPDLYRTGIALAPVPDMRLYDTIYQERYMGLPQENGEDYKRGSPLTHAAGLKGNLLVIHGTGDDNCHYQGVERLADKLVELNKTFTMMAYPNRSHSINEGKNTTRHLYGMLTRYFNDNLSAGPKP
ncbi:MAG: S9 family peptidase [Planctomycetaceae bacterium]|nr:S9 family peptidase [Planctomycetaceae bacterium]